MRPDHLLASLDAMLSTLLATDYHQLGITAQDRGRLDEADDWYRKSLTIEEDLGNAPAWRSATRSLASPRKGASPARPWSGTSGA
jgi:hypothetical protein